MSKKPKKHDSNRQKNIGGYVSGTGQLLMGIAFIVCLIDVFAMNLGSGFSVPLHLYLIGIFSGVGLQFVGAAISNMRFAQSA